MFWTYDLNLIQVNLLVGSIPRSQLCWTHGKWGAPKSHFECLLLLWKSSATSVPWQLNAASNITLFEWSKYSRTLVVAKCSDRSYIYIYIVYTRLWAFQCGTLINVINIISAPDMGQFFDPPNRWILYKILQKGWKADVNSRQTSDRWKQVAANLQPLAVVKTKLQLNDVEPCWINQIASLFVLRLEAILWGKTHVGCRRQSFGQTPVPGVALTLHIGVGFGPLKLLQLGSLAVEFLKSMFFVLLGNYLGSSPPKHLSTWWKNDL